MIYFPDDVSGYIVAWGAGVFLALIGKATKQESRALLLGVALAVVAPSPSSLVVAGVLTLFLKLADLIHIDL